jgi:hypothetical protein
MKKAIIVTIVSFAIISVLQAQEFSESISKAQEHLKHANTYYWLSRARSGYNPDIKNYVYHASEAKKILEEELDRGNKEDSSEAERLLQKANDALKAAEAQLDEHHDLIVNSSPIFSSITGQENILEFYDDAKDLALERSVINVLASDPWRKTTSQLYLLLLSSDNDPAEEEIGYAYINNNTNFYAISRHELAGILDKDELSSLYEKTIPQNVLNKIAEAFSISGLGILKIKQNDCIDSLYYYGSTFNYWDAEKKKYGRNHYADGFCEQCRSTFWVYLFLLLSIPGTFLINKLNKNSKGSFPPIWLSGLVAVITIIIVSIAFPAISSVGIDKATLIPTPSGIMWLFSIVAILALLPILLIYVISPRIPHISSILNNPETISSLLFGSALGAICFVMSHLVTLAEASLTIKIGLISIVVTFLTSFFLGRAYSTFAVRHCYSSLVTTVILLLFQVSVLSFVYISNVAWLTYAATSSILIIPVACYIPDFIGRISDLLNQQTKISRRKINSDWNGLNPN